MLTALIFREPYEQSQSKQKFLLVDFTDSPHYYLQNTTLKRTTRKKKGNVHCSGVWGDQFKIGCESWALSIVCLCCMWQLSSCYTACYREKTGRRELVFCTGMDYIWSSIDCVYKTIILCNAILLYKTNFKVTISHSVFLQKKNQPYIRESDMRG